MNDALDKWIAEDKARRAVEAAAEPEPTTEELQRHAAFLRGWAKGNEIRLYDAATSYYRKGKFMTKVSQKVVAALLAAGLAHGTRAAFRMERAS